MVLAKRVGKMTRLDNFCCMNYKLTERKNKNEKLNYRVPGPLGIFFGGLPCWIWACGGREMRKRQIRLIVSKCNANTPTSNWGQIPSYFVPYREFIMEPIDHPSYY